MAKKTKDSDPAQSERFTETARKIEADEDPKKFEKVFKKIAPGKKQAS